MVALVGSGSVSIAKPKLDVPNRRVRDRAASASASPWYGSHSLDEPTRWSDSFRDKGKMLPALFLPAQSRNSRDLGVGKLLVSSRGLGDPNFAGTVVLLVHYDEKGVLGLILNRRTNVPLSEVLNLKAAKDRSDPVYLGGPVQPSAVIALLQSSAKIEKAESILEDVYMISDKDAFEQILSTHPDPNVFRVYLGYAGWTQDQLRAEVQLGAWHIFPAEAATVFNSDPDSLWPQMMQRTTLQQARAQPGPFR